MTSTGPLKCWNSMHIHNNSVLHYLYNMAFGLVIYSKTRAFKAKVKGLTSVDVWRWLCLWSWPLPAIRLWARRDTIALLYTYIRTVYIYRNVTICSAVVLIAELSTVTGWVRYMSTYHGRTVRHLEPTCMCTRRILIERVVNTVYVN